MDSSSSHTFASDDTLTPTATSLSSPPHGSSPVSNARICSRLQFTPIRKRWETQLAVSYVDSGIGKIKQRADNRREVAKSLQKGLSRFSDLAVKKAVSYKHASREIICHEMLSYAWRVEARERAIDFLQQIQSEAEEELDVVEGELEDMKELLGMRGIKDDIDEEDMKYSEASNPTMAGNFDAVNNEVYHLERQAFGRGLPLEQILSQFNPEGDRYHVPLGYDSDNTLENSDGSG
ncbi:hypothetical protein SERLA73DRAFT_77436 [Serpula lacrymans var. lacrymans S7.3]|uniref:Uncharacterized protein n=1 Tax=Serpula lacrymans var. lacrymans (strain S7.3) TaxID=936435 RepID=F8QA96_SERL3|nr:hypothetical protein SERLA73DRAFT_77436 [Serpula lacrymans var. lacrymans S7.3]